MICYRDMTFCIAPCKTVGCPRNFTDEVDLAARQWWNHDPDNAPIEFKDFSEGCDDHDPK